MFRGPTRAFRHFAEDYAAVSEADGFDQLLSIERNIFSDESPEELAEFVFNMLLMFAAVVKKRLRELVALIASLE